jgi:hypothetical protein
MPEKITIGEQCDTLYEVIEEHGSGWTPERLARVRQALSTLGFLEKHGVTIRSTMAAVRKKFGVDAAS